MECTNKKNVKTYICRYTLMTNNIIYYVDIIWINRELDLSHYTCALSDVLNYLYINTYVLLPYDIATQMCASA